MIDRDERNRIQRVLHGDEDAFDELVARWKRPVYNFLLRNAGNPEDAQELLQETFRSVFQKISSLKDLDKFSSWLFAIALNHCRMRFRGGKQSRTDYIEDMAGGDDSGALAVALHAGGPSSPEEQFSREEMGRVVRAAVRGLGDKYREVIVLKEYSGLKFTEIAEVLELPLSTVKSRLYLALEQLRKEILKKIKP